MLNNYFAKKEPSIEGLVRWIADLGGKAPAIKKLPAHPAAFGSFGALDPRIVNALKKRGVEALYSHQSAAVECALSGIDCVIATPTASGKTLCYNLPVMHAVCRTPARAPSISSRQRRPSRRTSSRSLESSPSSPTARYTVLSMTATPIPSNGGRRAARGI